MHYMSAHALSLFYIPLWPPFLHGQSHCPFLGFCGTLCLLLSCPALFFSVPSRPITEPRAQEILNEVDEWMNEWSGGMSELLTIFLDVYRDSSMQAVLMPEGQERKSDHHNQRNEEEIPGLYYTVWLWIHSPATVSTMDGGRTRKGGVPFPLPSFSPPPQQSVAFCLGHVLLWKEEKSLGVTERIKRLKRGPSGNSTCWDHVVQGRECGWVT